MPVSLQQFFNSANTVGDSASLFLQNGGESVGDTSSLHGIHKLSRSAKAEENRATVTAFLNALEQSPQFRNISADVRGILNAKPYRRIFAKRSSPRISARSPGSPKRAGTAQP